MKQMKPLLIAWFLSVSIFVASADAQSTAEATNKQNKPSIFKCMSEGRVTYSDTACQKALDKTEVTVKEANGYIPKASDEQFESDTDIEDQPSNEHGQQSRVSRESIANVQIAHKERCAQLQRDIESNKKMERETRSLNAPGNATVAGYASRVRDLEKQRKDTKCR
jgi:hypothetical protein